MESYLTAEISRSAILHNLQLLRAGIAGGAKLCAVVKADCYGHGVATLLPAIAPKADFLAVATPEEAIGVRGLGYRGGLLMFFSACAHSDGQDMRDALTELISAEVTLTVVAPQEVEVVAECSRRVGKRAMVHVKVDSGMGRSGVSPAAAAKLAMELRRCGEIAWTGAYTHLATADETDKAYALEQYKTFMEAVERAGGRKGLTLHCANSAGAIDLPQMHLDMVRPGIAMYGYQPSGDMHNRLSLRPCLRLTGKLMQIRTLASGSPCGYGLTHRFGGEARIGLAPVGYADGYLRCLSNKAVMKVGGKYVPVCGRVSMDQTIIDLTDVPAAKVGDEVEILSNDPAAPNSVENLARIAGTIPYELTCRLGRRVRRVLVD